jgi:hypothetical protein
MSTIYALCGGDILKMDQILLMPYQDVFLKMWYDNEVAEYQKRLREVMKNKK